MNYRMEQIKQLQEQVWDLSEQCDYDKMVIRNKALNIGFESLENEYLQLISKDKLNMDASNEYIKLLHHMKTFYSKLIAEKIN